MVTLYIKIMIRADFSSNVIYCAFERILVRIWIRTYVILETLADNLFDTSVLGGEGCRDRRVRH